jgi:spermidine/putrescine transport system permease protein
MALDLESVDLAAVAARPATGPPRPSHRASVWPLALSAPAGVWLTVFFVIPLLNTVRTSLSAQSTSLAPSGWSLGNYAHILSDYGSNLLNSLLIGGLATCTALLIATPLAYGVSFYGGRWRSLLLLGAFAPFLTSYLVRVIAWQTLLGADGPAMSFARALGFASPGSSLLGTPFAVTAGLSYQLIPFVLFPMYAAFSRIDRNLCDAADDLYSSRLGRRGLLEGAGVGLLFGALAIYTLSGQRIELGSVVWLPVVVGAGAVIGAGLTERFRYVLLPLSRAGYMAAAVLAFIPALGDYVNASLLGNVNTQMMGNVIQYNFLVSLDYPAAAAVSCVLLAVVLVLVGGYVRAAGGWNATEQIG